MSQREIKAHASLQGPRKTICFLFSAIVIRHALNEQLSLYLTVS